MRLSSRWCGLLQRASTAASTGSPLTLLGDFIFLPWKHAASTIRGDQGPEHLRALQGEHLEQAVLLHMQERLKTIEMDIKTTYGQEGDAAPPEELQQLEQFMSVLFSAMELDAENRALVAAMRKTVWEKPQMASRRSLRPRSPGSVTA